MGVKVERVFKFVAALALCYGASGVSVFFMGGGAVGSWYAGLAKPAMTPPDWVFGPVWTVLYLLMSISLFLVWDKGLDYPKVKAGIGLFLFQLLLNAVWTPIFFGYHLILLALVDIVLLFAAIFATFLVFRRISFFAGILLLPYLVWVGYAVILNGLIYYMN